MCHREYILSERSMASDGTSRSMALGAEQDEKDWSFIAMCDSCVTCDSFGGLMLKLRKHKHV